MSNHTPEPWEVFGIEDAAHCIKGGGKIGIARVPLMLDLDESEANAQLIADAPRLLRERNELAEALQQIRSKAWGMEGAPSTRYRPDAANRFAHIAKLAADAIKKLGR